MSFLYHKIKIKLKKEDIMANNTCPSNDIKIHKISNILQTIHVYHIYSKTILILEMYWLVIYYMINTYTNIKKKKS